MEPKKGIAEKGAATRLLEEFLERVPVGGTVPYAELSRIACVDVKATRWVLSRVRKTLEKKRRIVFDVIRGVGIKRVDSAGALGVSGSLRKRAGRTLKRGISVLGAVNPGDLTDSAKREFNTALVQITVASSALSSRKKVTHEIKMDQPGALDMVKRLFCRAVDEVGQANN